MNWRVYTKAGAYLPHATRTQVDHPMSTTVVRELVLQAAEAMASAEKFDQRCPKCKRQLNLLHWTTGYQFFCVAGDFEGVQVQIRPREVS